MGTEAYQLSIGRAGIEIETGETEGYPSCKIYTPTLTGSGDDDICDRQQKKERKRKKAQRNLNSYIRNSPSSTCKVQWRISMCLECYSQSFFAVGRGMAGGPARSDDVVPQESCQVLISHVKCQDPVDDQTNIEPHRAKI